MLMIRFQRIGRKNDAAFRIAVLEKSSGPKAGKYVDLVGTYNPKTKATTLQGDRIKQWVSRGAQISPSLMNLLISKGVYEGKKTQVISRKNLEKNKPAEVVAEAPAPEPAVVPETEPAPAEAPIETPTETEAAPVEETPEAPAVEPTPEEAPAVEETAPEAVEAA